MTDNGLKVSDIAPVGERPSDIIRGRVGIQIAGVGTIGGSPLAGSPSVSGDLFVYDSVTDTWVIVNDSTFGSPLTIKDEGVDTGADATSIDFTGAGVTATGAGAAKTVTIPGATAGTTLGWFNVKDAAYGAVGNGTTDDTAAINSAIAALVAAGRGVLYFPASTYKVTSALTTISVPALVLGDGMYGTGTTINFTSQTAVLFTTSAVGVSFSKLKLVNTFAGTASAGAAIVATNANVNVYDQVFIIAFYTSIDIEDSFEWQMRGCYIGDSHKYGVRIRNTASPDDGDWSISDSVFASATTADAAIRIESSGGGRIVNSKINGLTGTNNFVTGIDLAIGAGVATSVLLISNNSIENVSGDAIRAVTTGGGTYQSITISGVEALIRGNTGRLFNGSGSGLSVIDIDGCIATTSGTARAAISLTNCSTIQIGSVIIPTGFTSIYTNSGVTAFVDNTGAIAGVRITGTPSSGDVPIASSGTAAAWGPQTGGGGGVTGFAAPSLTLGTTNTAGAATTVLATNSTIAAFDATAPTTQALADAAAAGSAAVAARRDHKHGMFTGAAPSGGYGTAAAGVAGTVLRSDAVLAKPTAPDVDFSVDVTNNNASTSAHGLLKKLDNISTNFMNGQGNWAAPGVSAAGLASGTSFPGSPATNDLYVRTDINNIIFFYDGTRWRSSQVFNAQFATETANPASITGQIFGRAGLWEPTLDIYLLEFRGASLVNATNNGSLFWTVALKKASDNSTIGSYTTAADTAATYTNHLVSINAVSTEKVIYIDMTKTSTPGNIFVWPNVTYQIIST